MTQMIEPTRNLQPLAERPQIGPAPIYVRIACKLAPALVQRWLNRRDERLQARLGELINLAMRCESRAELERILGTPVYALAGHLFSSNGEGPDSVECYAKDGCELEVWFRNGKRWQATGWHRTHSQIEMARLAQKPPSHT